MTTVTVLDHPDPAITILISAPEAASLCNLGLSTWWRFLSEGKIPAPIRIGGAVRWRRKELYGWMEAGCPSREKWETMNKGIGKK
ncbi:MAG: helix-turn-helix domain-containing protein [Planctomycetota bacterium]|jgi:excisionase family DNA binding protein|nr:helix-turn-helix domain-containing protein [Planctomycetota bacterium]